MPYASVRSTCSTCARRHTHTCNAHLFFDAVVDALEDAWHASKDSWLQCADVIDDFLHITLQADITFLVRFTLLHPASPCFTLLHPYVITRVCFFVLGACASVIIR
jgi:hypothetical protein